MGLFVSKQLEDFLMDRKPTYEELEQRVKELEKMAVDAQIVAKELSQFFGVDSNGIINEWNLAAEKISSFRKEDVIGRNLVAEFITDDYKDSVKDVLVT